MEEKQAYIDKTERKEKKQKKKISRVYILLQILPSPSLHENIVATQNRVQKKKKM